METTPDNLGTAVGALRRVERELLGQLARVRGALRELGALDGQAPSGPQSARGPLRRRDGPKRLEQIAEVLRRAGRPLTAGEIAEELGAVWKSPGSVMRSLTRDQDSGPDEIIRPSTGLYTLRGLHSESMPEAVQRIRTVVVRQNVRRSRTLDTLIAVLKEAGRALHYGQIHQRMQERLPDLRWNHPAESIRQLAARSQGVVVTHGDRAGAWKLAEKNDQEEEGDTDGGDSPPNNGESPTIR